MAEQTHIITLQRTLADCRQEKRGIENKLEELLRDVAHYREQLAAFESMIKQTGDALQNALELPRDQTETPYEQRPYEPRYEQRYDQQRESRYEPRQDSRYDPRYDKPSYRNQEPQGYRPQVPNRLRPTDIDAALESIHRDEQGSNVRFADFRIPQAATIVLREANQPLHVSEIFRQLSEGGFEFRGQHQLITLAVSLSRSKRFRKVAPGTFELEPAYLAGQVA